MALFLCLFDEGGELGEEVLIAEMFTRHFVVNAHKIGTK